MDRRSFMVRAGLLFGALGTPKAFGVDLIDRIGRTLLPSAHASGVLPRRQLELCFRSGIPMMMFGTGREFTQLRMPRYSNFSYAGNQIVRVNGLSNLYMNQDSQVLMKHADNIAITQGVSTEGSGHTSMFNYREGGLGKSLTTPIVELADLNTTSSIVHGVKWPGNAVNRRNQAKDLIALNANSAFVSLFKNRSLRLEKEELKLVLQAAQSLSRRQAIMLEDKLKGSLQQVEGHRKAHQMFMADYSKLLNTDGMPSALTTGSTYRNVRDALAYSLRGMQHNLINSSMVVIELGDWHGYQSDKQNSAIVREMSRMISAAVDFLKSTPEPAAPGLTLWDTTTIVAGSEFTRGISKFGFDNNDGGTQGVMLIGKNVKGNYYGGFTLTDTSDNRRGVAHGFDKDSGAVTMNQVNLPEQVYFTVRHVSGLSLSTTERTKVLSCMVA